MSRSQLSDYLHAVRRLSPTDDGTRRAIAALVGLRPSLLAHDPPKSTVEPDSSSDFTQVPEPPRLLSKGAPAPPQVRGTPYVPPPPSATVASTLVTSRAGAVQPPMWLAEVEALELPTEGATPTLPVPESLLDPHQSRAILFDLLSTAVADGPMDVDSLVRARAAGRSLPSIPKAKRATLSYGVQVLMDRGEGMLPFVDDMRQLLGLVRRVVGASRVAAHEFRGSPLRGAGTGSRRRWQSYEAQLPAPATVVLVVTDLGTGGRRLLRDAADPEEWAAFARRLRRHGCPIRALVPYPSSRWPPGLEWEMGIIPWDRSTRSGLVHRLVADFARRETP